MHSFRGLLVHTAHELEEKPDCDRECVPVGRGPDLLDLRDDEILSFGLPFQDVDIALSSSLSIVALPLPLSSERERRLRLRLEVVAVASSEVGIEEEGEPV